MVNRVHVIDPDVRRRARVSRELNTYSVHAEIYEDIQEFLQIAPTEGLVLAADGSAGQRIGDILRTSSIHLPIVGYAEDPSTGEVVEAMLAGAAGFLRWPFDDREFIDTLNRISDEGELRVRRERMLFEAKAQVESLSRRERQVLTALIGGLSNKQIGQALEISPRTVEIHRSHMMTKLKAQSVADAVRMALYAGLDDDWGDRHLARAA